MKEMPNAGPRAEASRMRGWVVLDGLTGDPSLGQWLVVAELQRFLEMRRQSSETAVMRAFRDWLRFPPA